MRYRYLPKARITISTIETQKNLYSGALGTPTEIRINSGFEPNVNHPSPMKNSWRLEDGVKEMSLGSRMLHMGVSKHQKT